MSKGFRFNNIIATSIGGTIGTSEDDENVADSLRMILSTKKGSRAGMPEFGCDLVDRVFDPNDLLAELVIKEDIADAIQAWEPRVDLSGIVLSTNPDDYTVDIELIYDTIKVNNEEVTKHSIT